MNDRAMNIRGTIPHEQVRPESEILTPTIAPRPATDKPTVVAVIPARGGSKGIHKKNIKPLCGKPLIAYTIDVALRSNLIDHVYVSTDCPEIAEVAQEHGATVPGLRSSDLARDKSSLKFVYEEAEDRIRAAGVTPDLSVRMLPTHLFRTPALVDYLIGKCLSGFSNVLTVRETPFPSNQFFTNTNGVVRPVTPAHVHPDSCSARQYCRPYGLVTLSSSQKDVRSFVYVIKDPVSLVDIDTMEDFYLAEEIIKEGLFDFTNSLDPFSDQA